MADLSRRRVRRDSWRRPRATMTDRQWIQWVHDESARQLLTDPDGGGGEVDSPTGRTPRLLWTSTLQRGYNRMLEERQNGDTTLGAVWCDLILDNAMGNRYGDSGLWATLAYQITGDISYVDLAWTKIEAMLSSSLDDDNNTRELALERVVMLDWLWPGLTDARRTEYFTALDRMFTNADLAAVRRNDSDQTTGVYFGTAAYHAAFGDVHPQATAFFETPCVGGYAVTGTNIDTMRNAVSVFVTMAAGGEWIESSEYNLGTVRLLVLGASALKTATGIDHFPEVTAWSTDAALRYRLMLTPDRVQSFQWGDEQHPHNLQVWMHVCTMMLFNDPDARQLVYDLVDQYGARGSYSAEPTTPRSFLLFDPYGPQAETERLMLDARGQGHVAARTSHDEDASMLCAHHPPTGSVTTVDHAVFYVSNLQLYRQQRWALTCPIAYGGVGNNGWGANGMLHRGIGAPREWRGSNTVYTGSDWVFTAITAGGTILASKFYQPPQTFWHEWSRSVLWIQGDVDTIIIFDRSHLDDPLALPGCSKYPDDIEKKFNTHPLRLWRWHCPVPPTLGATSASWVVGDETTRISWLRSDLQPSIHDQSVEWASQNMPASEKKFHLDLAPDDVAGFETLVTVIECGDPSLFSSITRHHDDTQCVDAVELSRSGRATWAVLFNAQPGPRLPTYGGAGSYHPEIPGLLAPVRLREVTLPATGIRLWGMETATGIPTSEP